MREIAAIWLFVHVVVQAWLYSRHSRASERMEAIAIELRRRVFYPVGMDTVFSLAEEKAGLEQYQAWIDRWMVVLSLGTLPMLYIAMM